MYLFRYRIELDWGMMMKNFKEIRREYLINKANELLDRADLLVDRIIANARTAEQAKEQKAKKAA